MRWSQPEQGVKGGPHAALVSWYSPDAPLTGGVAQQGEHAVLAQLSGTGQIDHAAETGVGNLKSPVWTTVLTGHLMARATASAMEWLM